MPNLKKVIAGLALSTAVAGGAIALGATAASADGMNDNGIANANRGGTGGIAQDNNGLGGFFPGFGFGHDDGGVANGNRGGTGGIAQGNNGLGGGFGGFGGFPAFATGTPFNNFNNNNNQNQNQNLNNNQNNRGSDWWWNNQGWWGQGLWKDGRNDHSAFGVVAKDVALGFQDKTNRDNNFFNNNWLQNNNFWDNNDNYNNNNWNNLRQ